MKYDPMLDPEPAGDGRAEPDFPESGPTPEEVPEPADSGFAALTDEEIILLCHNGDPFAEEYLLNKYKNFVRSKA